MNDKWLYSQKNKHNKKICYFEVFILSFKRFLSLCEVLEIYFGLFLFSRKFSVFLTFYFCYRHSQCKVRTKDDSFISFKVFLRYSEK